MITQSPTQQTHGTKPTKGLRFSVRDVTGTHSAVVELDPDLRVGKVAETLAARLSLPNDTAWALRDEATAAFLDDEAAIGEAIIESEGIETALVVTPRAHLG